MRTQYTQVENGRTVKDLSVLRQENTTLMSELAETQSRGMRMADELESAHVKLKAYVQSINLRSDSSTVQVCLVASFPCCLINVCI